METTDGEVRLSLLFLFCFLNAAAACDSCYVLIADHPYRRRLLAQLGSATGVYKTLVKYLVGVPQVCTPYPCLDLYFEFLFCSLQ